MEGNEAAAVETTTAQPGATEAAAATTTTTEQQPAAKQGSETASGTEGGESTDEGGAKKDPRTYTQDEVDEITRRVRRNVRHFTRKETEAELYEKFLADQRKGANPEPAAKAQESARPKRDDFATHEEFVRADAVYEALQAVEAKSKKEAAEASAREKAKSAEQQERTFAEGVEKARKEIPDFDEIIEASEAPMSQTMREVILESAVGPQLAYHLATNLEDARRIVNLSERQTVRELAKIEAAIEAKSKAAGTTTAAAAKPSGAPKPASTSRASGGDTNPTPGDLSKMPFEQYREYRRKQGANF